MADLTYQDFVDFFEAKRKGTYSCPFCGSVHFVPAMDLSGTVPGELVVQLQPAPGIVMPASHNYFAIACTNCGRSDFFHVNQVMQWKALKSGGQP